MDQGMPRKHEHLHHLHHARRAALHAPQGLGEHIADRVTAFSGSWLFLGLHAIWWVLWIAILRIEAFPFGLLTMLLSLEAIVLSTLVLMSQEREGRKNHRRDDAEAIEVHELFELNRGETAILHEIRDLSLVHQQILGALHAMSDELRCKGKNSGCSYCEGAKSGCSYCEEASHDHNSHPNPLYHS